MCKPGSSDMWRVNVLFKHPAWAHPALPVLDDLVKKHQGQMDVSGSGHQAWAFPTREDAYRFAEEEAVAILEIVVIEPEPPE